VRAGSLNDAEGGGTVTIDTPVSDAAPDPPRQARLRAQSPELWQFGDLFLNRRRQVVLLQLPGHSEDLTDTAIGDFNRVFAPYARVTIVHVPAGLTTDGTHLTSTGAAQLARALWNARPGDPRP